MEGRKTREGEGMKEEEREGVMEGDRWERERGGVGREAV